MNLDLALSSPNIDAGITPRLSMFLVIMTTMVVLGCAVRQVACRFDKRWSGLVVTRTSLYSPNTYVNTCSNTAVASSSLWLCYYQNITTFFYKITQLMPIVSILTYPFLIAVSVATFRCCYIKFRNRRKNSVRIPFP